MNAKPSSNEAAVAQLVEHHVAKSEVNATTYVDESSLVSRSKLVLENVKSTSSNEAAVAQLVEHHVANVNVTSSSLVSRSNYCLTNRSSMKRL